MAGSLLASFAAPGIAAAAIGLSAVIATSVGIGGAAPAYGDALQKYEIGTARVDAAALFGLADINKDGALDSDEYTALSIVTAELSRLNGFVTLNPAAGAEIIVLPIDRPAALTGRERIRVEAVARNEFYVAAGGDDEITREEFVTERLERFDAADRNRNGALTKNELTFFAASEARLSLSKA